MTEWFGGVTTAVVHLIFGLLLTCPCVHTNGVLRAIPAYSLACMHDIVCGLVLDC